MTHPPLWSLAPLLGFLMFVASACGEASQLAETDGPKAQLVFDTDSSVSRFDSRLVESTAKAARDYYAKELGRDFESEVTVRITDDDGGDRWLGWSAGRKLWIYTGNERWPDDSSIEAHYLKENIVAHELFHNFEWSLADSIDGDSDRLPFWLLEGGAEYASAHYLAEIYEVDWPDMVAYYKVRPEEASTRLEDVRVGTPSDYSKAFQAINALMGDRPLRDLGAFFEATGRTEWDDAFRQTFHQDPAKFLDAFEATFE